MKLIRIALLCIVAAACGDGTAPPAPAAAERDSAGIRIVEHTVLPSDTLRIDPQPVVSIGTLDGAEEYQLHSVGDVALLSDGTVVIAHSSHRIGFYDARGAHIRTVGRSGSGPGEFRQISLLRRIAGDSLLAYDAVARRVTVLAPDGAYVRDHPFELRDTPFASAVDALEDGALVARINLNPPAGSRGMTRDTLQYSLVRGDSAVPLRAYPGAETQFDFQPAAGGAGVASLAIRRAAFSRPSHITVAGDRVVTASSDDYELHFWSPDGALSSIVRSAHAQRQPVSDELFAAWAEQQLRAQEREATARGMDFDEAAARRQQQNMPRSDFVPMFTALAGAQDGGVWVKSFAMPGNEAPDEWIVFAAHGTARGRVLLPNGFEPHWIADDVVYGMERDELDVERVTAYRVGG